MTSNDLCGRAEGSGKSGGFQGYRDTDRKGIDESASMNQTEWLLKC